MESRVSKNVFDVDYMKAIKFSLNTIAQWPNKAFGEETRAMRILARYNYVIITIASFLLSRILLFVRKNIKIIPFVDMGHSYTNILLSSVCIQRISTLPFQNNYRLLMKKFVLEFHLNHHQHLTTFAKKEQERVNKICRIVAIIIHLQMFCGMILYNIVPLYNNIQAEMFTKNRPHNKTFEQSVDLDLPFNIDQYNDMTSYLAIFFLNLYSSYYVTFAICCYDLLLFVMIFHTLGHLNILIHDLKFFPRPNSEHTGQTAYKDAAFVMLKDITRHYQTIKQFMAEVSKVFNISLCFYLAFHQVAGCILLLECSTMTPAALGKYGLLTLIVFQQLIQTSVIFELISSKSEILKDEVYCLPWELMDNKNRKVVLMLLRDVQTPLALKAGGMVPVGVRTMSTIIKTSFSYFLMLNTITHA